MFENKLKMLFSESDLKAISGAVSEVEKKTTGEVRVAIRQRRANRERRDSIEQIARREFHALGMTGTKARTGVLLFLLLEDRQFHILADEGIHSKVDENTWRDIASQISAHFSEKKFREGVLRGVHSIGSVLAKHFPKSGDDKNELSNEVKVD